MRAPDPTAVRARLARPRDPLATLVLLAGMAVCAGLILYWTRDRIFAIDEWEYFIGRRGWDLETLLRPINGHLLALPLAVYKVLLDVFGGTSHLPFTLLTVVLHLGVVAMLYLIARERLGAWGALVPAGLILFLGSGWEVMLNTAAMQNQFGIIAGLGALAVLDRRGRRGDPLAAVLLACSLASFTIGLAFAFAALVFILLDRVRWSRSRLWVVAAPLLAYAVWFAWARKFHQGETSAGAVAALGSGVFDQLSAILEGLTGLFRKPPGVNGTEGGDVLVFIFAGLIALRFARAPRPTPAQGAALAALAAYLVLVGLGLSEIRPPGASRYIYMGGVLVVLAGVELWPATVRLRWRWLAVGAAALLLALMANVAGMKGGADFIKDESAYNRAELGALDLARDQVNPAFVPEPTSLGPEDPPHQDLVFNAAQYFAAVGDYGSPADSESELAAEPAGPRAQADKVSAAALAVAAEPGKPAGSGPPPQNLGALNADVEEHGACLRVTPLVEDAPAAVTVEVPAGGVGYEAERPPKIAIGRFADDQPVAIPPTSRAGTLSIPADASSRPWRASFAFTGSGKVCG
jgi:hypothetical protein